MDLHKLAILYDIREFLGVEKRQRVVVCPLPDHPHKNFTPSFSIMENKADGHQRWHCHGACGKSGDIIDLAGYMNISGYNPNDRDHLEQAIAILDTRVTVRPPEIPEKEPILNNLDFNNLETINVPSARYLRSRGISYDTARHFRLREKEGAIAIPTFEHNHLKMIKYRRIKSGGMRYWSERGSVAGLFNHDEVYGAVRPVLIVKSELAAMFMWERLQDIKVCAPSGGENSHVDRYFEIMACAPRRVVIGDNDRDPSVREKMNAFAQRRAHELQADLRFPPEAYKDVDEWLLDRPQDIGVIEVWLKR